VLPRRSLTAIEVTPGPVALTVNAPVGEDAGETVATETFKLCAVHGPLKCVSKIVNGADCPVVVERLAGSRVCTCRTKTEIPIGNSFWSVAST
jgi:hypothetical protein